MRRPEEKKGEWQEMGYERGQTTGYLEVTERILKEWWLLLQLDRKPREQMSQSLTS